MKISTGFRLSGAAKEQLKVLAEHHGLSQAGVLEMLIREAMRKIKGAK